jgi:hypothetical protein
MLVPRSRLVIAGVIVSGAATQPGDGDVCWR